MRDHSTAGVTEVGFKGEKEEIWYREARTFLCIICVDVKILSFVHLFFSHFLHTLFFTYAFWTLFPNNFYLLRLSRRFQYFKTRSTHFWTLLRIIFWFFFFFRIKTPGEKSSLITHRIQKRHEIRKVGEVGNEHRDAARPIIIISFVYLF